MAAIAASWVLGSVWDATSDSQGELEHIPQLAGGGASLTDIAVEIFLIHAPGWFCVATSHG